MFLVVSYFICDSRDIQNPKSIPRSTDLFSRDSNTNTVKRNYSRDLRRRRGQRSQMVAKTAFQAVFVHNERERETRDYNHPLMALDFTIRWTDNLFTLHLNYRFDSIAIQSQINNYNTRDTYIYIATAAIDQQHRPHRPFKLSRPLRNMS